MENRFAFASLFVAFLVTVGTVSPQILDAPVPCNDKLNSSCSHPRLPTNARCVAGFCLCPDVHGVPKNCSTRDISQPTLVHNPVTGHPCKVQQDCDLMNGYCNTARSQCVCSENYVMSSGKWECLPIARSMGSKCEDNDQCQASDLGKNTVCIGGQCVCAGGYHFVEETCYKTIGFGEQCTNHHECSHVEYAECVVESSQCGCSKNATVTANGHSCLPVVQKMFMGCREKAQCTKKFPNADCIESKCECPAHTHYEESLNDCVATRTLGQRCEDNFECLQSEAMDDGPSHICKDQICVCNDGFVEDANKCIRSSASSLISGFGLLLLALLFSRS